MPKIKTFLLLTLALVFSISLFGCGLFSSDTAAPEELTGQDGELPEWLLAAHREVEGPGTETTDDLAEEEDDLAVGGTDEDDGVTAPSAVQETPAQPTATNTSTPAPAPAPAPAPEPDIFATPSPGTREYAVWFAETGATGSYSDWLKEKMKKEAEAEEAEEQKNWFDGTPSGFGSDGF